MAEGNNEKKTRSKKGHLARIVRDGISIAFWIYVPIKLFVFDIDQYVLSSFCPNYLWLLKYKLPFVLLILAFLWITIKPKKLFLNAIYVLFFPIVILLWKVPKLLFGAPFTFVMATILSVILVIKSAKIWFISFVCFFSAYFFILIDVQHVVTICAAIFILLLLGRHYFFRFYYAFKPENILTSIIDFLKTTWAEKRWDFFLKDIRDSSKYPLGSEKYLKKRFETLSTFFVFQEFLTFVTYKLKKFHESRFITIFSILKLVFSFFLTVVSFGFIYAAIGSVFPEDFSPNYDKNVFTYMYFSFNKLLMMDVPNLSAVGVFSGIASVLQSIFGLSLGVILFFIFTTIIKDRSEKELGELIDQIELESKKLVLVINDEFGSTFDEIGICQ